ncbi:MAG: hypothetical protein U0599_26320 [Vicinamibacteria bacterium]
MSRGPRLFPLLSVVALALAPAVAARAEDALPQLGKSPTKDVVAAMTREEKVAIVIGAA